MSYTPVKTDATNVAAYVITRLNTATPSSGATTNDQNTAVADAYLNSLGYQGQTNVSLGSVTTTSTSYADVTGSSVTFTAPVAKIYLVTVNIKPFMTGAQDGINFQLLNNSFVVMGASGNGAMGQFIITAQLVAYQNFTFSVPVLMVAGSNTLKLQWQLQFGNPSAVAHVDSSSCLVYTFTG
jgi:hypothetical protein